jgi:hypothetical protein
MSSAEDSDASLEPEEFSDPITLSLMVRILPIYSYVALPSFDAFHQQTSLFYF